MTEQNVALGGEKPNESGRIWGSTGAEALHAVELKRIGDAEKMATEAHEKMKMQRD